MLVNKTFLIFSFLFWITTDVFAERSSFSIEFQGANEVNNCDFYSISLSIHDKGLTAHRYAQINYSGFTNTYDVDGNPYRNLFIGIGAEYNGQISPYIEAGADAGLFGLIILDAIIDDTLDNDCIEDDNCLSAQYNEDTYLTIGARLFVTQRLTIGAFVEYLSFGNPDTDKDTHFKVSGINIRYIFN
jgi:hypothetical protein